MIYYIHEANLSLPEECQDQSVNIFSFPANSDRGPASITIPRESFIGRDHDAFADQKLAEAAQNLRGYRLHERRRVTIGGESAIEFEYTWSTPDGKNVRQLQSTVVLGGQCIAFTLSTLPEDANSYHETWRSFLDSVVFREG